MRNVGKIFEDSVKKSVPDYVLMYRLPDSAQSFNNSSLRFSNKNPFDFFMWDSKDRYLFPLELKSVGGKSISFEREKGESGNIHYHQIVGLNKWNQYNGIISGFIIEFRALEKTIYLGISEFNTLAERISKKSFTIDDLDKNKIPYFVISQKKARTRYSYDMDSLIKNLVQRNLEDNNGS